MLGNIIRANGEYLIAFDLTSTEVYQRTYDKEGAKSTASRTPVYPIGWQNQFGMTFNEHKQSMLVNIFEGYAIYSIILLYTIASFIIDLIQTSQIAVVSEISQLYSTSDLVFTDFSHILHIRHVLVMSH